MQTQADVASDTELCESVSSTIVPEEDVPVMTVKQEEEEAAVLCQSPEPPPPPATAVTAIDVPSAATNVELLSPEDQQKLAESPSGSSSGPQNDKVERGRGRGRRRYKWKLKFHHQALPPEYLDHYEASMAQQEAKSNVMLAGVKAAHGSRGNSDKTPSKHSVKQSHGTRGSEKPISDAKSAAERSSKQSCSPIQYLQVKLEPESQSLPFSIMQASLLNTTAATAEPSRLIPLQTLNTGPSGTDMISRLQDTFQSHHIDDDISIINETKVPPLNNLNKGLLGCLLSSNQQSSENTSPTEASNGNRNVPNMNVEQRQNANAKRRSSVIMSSSSATSPNFSTGTSANSSVSQQQSSTSKVMKYQDLPYMGEITLDNMKPRRGRKPKKADICHLIYKNYGTIFPGAPNSIESEEIRKKSQSETFADPSSSGNNHKNRLDSSASLGIKCKAIETLKSNGGSQINHADVQNRIISSLLEKRLTAAAQQESSRKSLLQNTSISEYSPLMLPPNCSGAWNKRTIPMALSSPVLPIPSPSATPACSDEPLNLCVKDLNQLKIRLLRKHGNFYEPRSSTTNSSEESASMKHTSNMSPISVKSEPPSHVSDLEEMLEVSNDSLKYSGTPDEICGDNSRLQVPIPSNLTESFQPSTVPGLTFPTPAEIPGVPPGTAPLPAGYMYWPGAGVFVHPMAIQSQLLYYQKMGAVPLVSMPTTEPGLSSQTFLPAAPVSIPRLGSNSLQPPQSPKSISSVSKSNQKQALSISNSKHIIPKHFSSGNQGKNSNLMPSELSFPRMKRLPSLGNAASAISGGAKRKRSAIFIPPMPSENNSSPTTEVSICKFKFTGGAKPSLQEKKMLSVDSGGNFRYYSGTGDKSMRGYEFFPRESLQQPSGVTGGSPSEHFLAAAASASEKIPPNVTVALRESSGIGAYSLDEHKKLLSSVPADAIVKGIGSPFNELNQSVVLSSEADSSRKMVDGRIFLDQTARNKSDSSDAVDSSVVTISGNQQGPSSQHFRFQRRKRKTRKSLAREKLEQTFKEKGFLIQTQQLESAEGATYCKFRQLRKFTRYLFRSWKDYLPGNVREMSVAAGVAGSSPPHQDDSDGEVSSNSPTPTLITPQTSLDEVVSKPSPAT